MKLIYTRDSGEQKKGEEATVGDVVRTNHDLLVDVVSFAEPSELNNKYYLGSVRVTDPLKGLDGSIACTPSWIGAEWVEREESNLIQMELFRMTQDAARFQALAHSGNNTWVPLHRLHSAGAMLFFEGDAPTVYFNTLAELADHLIQEKS